MVLEVRSLNSEYNVFDRQNIIDTAYANWDKKDKETSIFNSARGKGNKFKNNIKDNDKAYKAGLYGLSFIPTIRKIGSLPDSIEQDNWTRAGLLTGLAAAAFPRDWQEVKFAFEELKGNSKGIGEFFANAGKNFSKAVHDPFNPFQRRQTYLKDTFRFLDNFYNKHKWLKKLDITLDYTNWGKNLMNALGIDKPDKTEFELAKNDVKSVVKGYKFNGNYAQRLFARSLSRISIIGVALTTALEIPALIKSVQKGNTFEEKAKSFGKQLLKSAAYAGLVTIGISVGGAAAAAGGTLLSLVGMGIGSSLALMASNRINKMVDKNIA